MISAGGSGAESSVEPVVVVDTNVVSYIFKGDTRAPRYEAHLRGRTRIVSFMSVAELDGWAEQRNWGPANRAKLALFLTGAIIHYPDRETCRLWGRLVTAARRAGRPIGSADAWIAATALNYDVPPTTPRISPAFPV